jgi:hypothetical protein
MLPPLSRVLDRTIRANGGNRHPGRRLSSLGCTRTTPGDDGPSLLDVASAHAPLWQDGKPEAEHTSGSQSSAWLAVACAGCQCQHRCWKKAHKYALSP